MSTRRPVSTPPRIDGYTYLSVLGSGGFADVFLYEQHRPRRKVAVKVLLAAGGSREGGGAGKGLDAAARRRFDAEADLMATLSSHPNIVTILEVGVAGDARPYLAMEYCPKPNLGQRFRAERMSVPEVLSIGIQVAGAVETAHRAGILHRDIKPANILVTEYNRPALADFGIASVHGAADEEETGLSVPWSPPEVVDALTPGTPQTDVWSLAATVYSLLAGRSPFEVPGRPDTVEHLMARIKAAQLPPLGRPDVPGTLEAALAAGMARDPRSRYGSALAFARALQHVQSSLALPVTHVDVVDASLDGGGGGRDEDDGRTRVRGVVTIDPYVSRTGARPGTDTAPPAPGGFGGTHLRPRFDARPAPPPQPRVEDTQLRATHTGPAPTPAAHRSRWPLVLAGGTLAVAAGGAAVFALQGGEPRTQPGGTGAPAAPIATGTQVVSGELTVPAPTDVVGVGTAEGVRFTWVNPDPRPGDQYLWTPLGTGGEEPARQTGTAVALVQPNPAGRTCVEVVLVRGSGRASDEPATGCL